MNTNKISASHPHRRSSLKCRSTPQHLLSSGDAIILKTKTDIIIINIISSRRNKQDQHPNQNQYYAPQDAINKMLIDLSAIVGLDGVPLHFQLFPKLWLDIYSSRCDNRHVLMKSFFLKTRPGDLISKVLNAGISSEAH